MAHCIFCEIIAKRTDPDLTIFENDQVIALVSLRQKPSNHGHALVISKRHIETIYELPEDLNAPLVSALRSLARATKKAFSTDGIQIRQNNEPAANQDVFHLHFHIVPRYLSDAFEAKTYEILPLQTRRALASRV